MAGTRKRHESDTGIDFETIDGVAKSRKLRELLGQRDVQLIGAGGLLILLALRVFSHSRARAIFLSLIGGTLIRSGVRRRRESADDEVTEYEETEDSIASELGEGLREREHLPEEEKRPDAEKVEEEAAAARGELESVDEQDVRPSLSVPDAADDDVDRADDSDDTDKSDDTLETGASSEDIDGDAGDPRRTLPEDEEVDVSDTAMADEPGEATGPDAVQAEPTQTEATEPEQEPPADGTSLNHVDEPENREEAEDGNGGDGDESTDEH